MVSQSRSGYDRYNTKGERIGKCARGEGEGKPKCLSKEKAAKMSKSERAAAVRRKRAADPVADRAGKGGKPIMTSNKIDEAKRKDPCWVGWKQVGMKKKGDRLVPNCVKEETTELLYEKNKPTNPSLWSRAKALARSKFDVYPSAYANGWAAKWYKKRGGGWKSVKEEFSEAVRIPTQTGHILDVYLNWRGKYYSIKMFFPQLKLPTRKELQVELEKVYPSARVLSSRVSEYVPGQPFLNVSESEIWATREENSVFDETASNDSGS